MDNKTTQYAGFACVDDLIKDHRDIKKQIKEREKSMDDYVRILDRWTREDVETVRDNLDHISQEMMTINI